MEDFGPIGLLLLLANVAFSYTGFIDPRFFSRYLFEVDGILIGKEYVRMLSSGFLHANWLHLGFNMMSLLAFSSSLETEFSAVGFVAIYFASLIGGNLLALFIHRNHGDYRAVGASGAVCGVIFACIALFPGIEIGLLLLPYSIPGWAFGVLFVAISIFGIKSNSDNIGHEAHLGGALVGMIVAIAWRPEMLQTNLWPILVVTLPTLVFLSLIITRPHILLLGNAPKKAKKKPMPMGKIYNNLKIDRQAELDRILDKIKSHGMEGLTEEEKRRLEQF